MLHTCSERSEEEAAHWYVYVNHQMFGPYCRVWFWRHAQAKGEMLPHPGGEVTNRHIICQDGTIRPRCMQTAPAPTPKAHIYKVAYSYLTSYKGSHVIRIALLCHSQAVSIVGEWSLKIGRDASSINKPMNSWNITCTRIVRQHQIGSETGFDGWRCQTESNFH